MINNLVLYIQVNNKFEIKKSILSKTNPSATLTFFLHVKMGNVADGKILSADASTWPPLPLKVKVTYNGQVKEITQSHQAQWNGSFPYVPLSTLYDPTGYCSSNGYKYSVFQLTLEFKDTSFAEGELHVLTHLSKLLDTQCSELLTLNIMNEF